MRVGTAGKGFLPCAYDTERAPPERVGEEENRQGHVKHGRQETQLEREIARRCTVEGCCSTSSSRPARSWTPEIQLTKHVIHETMAASELLLADRRSGHD